MAVMEKKIFSLSIATVAMSKNYAIKSSNLIDLDNHWKNWIDWISTSCNKMWQPQKFRFWEE